MYMYTSHMTGYMTHMNGYMYMYMSHMTDYMTHMTGCCTSKPHLVLIFRLISLTSLTAHASFCAG